MKAMLKSELAACAGVSLRTLHRWCRPYRRHLERMGLKPGTKLLPPTVVQFLADKLCIDLPE